MTVPAGPEIEPASEPEPVDASTAPPFRTLRSPTGPSAEPEAPSRTPLERLAAALPDLLPRASPQLPTFPALPALPTLPVPGTRGVPVLPLMLAVVSLAAVLTRGDRRDPKLVEASIDGGWRL